MASGCDGLRFANVHVAGDRAHSNMLNLVERLQQQYGKDSTKNWAFDHCGMINPKDFPRLAKLNVTVSCYVLLSVNGGANMARAYGDSVANTFPSPLNSMVKAGVKVVLESDSNSFLWEDIEAAVTRKDRQGRVWGPQERVDRPTALRMITRWAGDYFLKGDQIGSIEKGKFADIVVLDKDYLTIAEESIGDIRPQLTVFDGKIVFVHPNFASEYNLRPAGALISTYEDLVKTRKSRPGASTGG
jgi:predicted amidohydrolase YtcJ